VSLHDEHVAIDGLFPVAVGGLFDIELNSFRLLFLVIVMEEFDLHVKFERSGVIVELFGVFSVVWGLLTMWRESWSDVHVLLLGEF